MMTKGFFTDSETQDPSVQGIQGTFHLRGFRVQSHGFSPGGRYHGTDDAPPNETTQRGGKNG